MRKRRLKTFVATLISIILLLSMTGCGEDWSDIEIPVYENDQSMMLSGWLEPIHTLEDYKLAKESGLTHIFFAGTYIGGRETPEFEQAMEYCDQVGLDVIIRSVNTYPFTDTRDYRDFPAVTAINYWDEPFDTDFDKLSELADYHMEKYGDDLLFFVNLNPSETAPGWHPWSEDKTYEEYVDEFYDTVLSKITEGTKMISSDYYPLQVNSGVQSIKSGWLRCAEFIAQAAKKHNTDTNFFIQSSSWLQYPEMTLNDLRFQFSTLMTFGIRNFSYYTYNSYMEGEYGETIGLVSSIRSGKTNPVYYHAQKVNSELKAIEKVYLSFKRQGVMPVIGTMNESGFSQSFSSLSHPLDNIEFIDKYQMTQDTLLGSFVDGEGRDGLMVTNFTHPEAGEASDVKIKFKNARRVVMYKNGEQLIYNLKNNTINFRLDAGQGVFMIPLS